MPWRGSDLLTPGDSGFLGGQWVEGHGPLTSHRVWGVGLQDFGVHEREAFFPRANGSFLHSLAHSLTGWAVGEVGARSGAGEAGWSDLSRDPGPHAATWGLAAVLPSPPVLFLVLQRLSSTFPAHFRSGCETQAPPSLWRPPCPPGSVHRGELHPAADGGQRVRRERGWKSRARGPGRLPPARPPCAPLPPQSTGSSCGRPAGRPGWWCTAAWNGTWACCASTPGSPQPW